MGDCVVGRFNTADPYRALAGGGNDPGSPSSWNKYAYVGGDPVNMFDPQGLLQMDPLICGPYGEWCVVDDGGGEGGGDQGGGAGGVSPPPPPPPPKCQKGYQDWINAHGADAATVAKSLGINEAEVLGLSALESGWGTGSFVGGGQNAFFNLEVRVSPKNPNPSLLAYSTGWSIPQLDPNVRVATYASFLDSAKSFAAIDGHYIQNVTDVATFATDLHVNAKFGVGNGNFIRDLTSIIKKLAKCLQ